MTGSEMIGRLSARLGISKRQARKFFYALIEETKISLANLEDVRFPLFGKFVAEFEARKRVPCHPQCALCEKTIYATPRHVIAAHGMKYRDYCDMYGGQTYLEPDGTRQISIVFKMFPGLREELMVRGPLQSLVEEDHGTTD